MKERINQLFTDRLIRQSTLLTLLFLLFSILIVAITWQSMPPIIPLYNQQTWGDARLAAKFLLFLPSVIVFIFVVLNLLFMHMYIRTMPLVARFLSITLTFCALLVFVFTLRTLQLII
jgi:hypothetical protein